MFGGVGNIDRTQARALSTGHCRAAAVDRVISPHGRRAEDQTPRLG